MVARPSALLALALALVLVMDAARQARASRGYALAFNREGSIIGHKKGFVDFDDPGMDQLDNAMTVTMWIRTYTREINEGYYTFRWSNEVDEELINPWLLYGPDIPVINYLFQEYYEVGEHAPDQREWHHYGFTLAPDGNVHIYIDGDIYVDVVLPDPVSVVGERTIVTVGGDLFHTPSAIQPQVNPLGGFHGEIDELTVWSRALTQAEVQGLARSALDVTALPAEAVLAYTFDVEHCELSADPECGTDPELIRNYGSAGRDYDLMRGKLKYAPGPASDKYQSSHDPDGAPLRTFEKPVLHRSDVPLAPAEFFPAMPTVVEAVPGASAMVAIPIAFGNTLSVASVRALPSGATLFVTATGGSQTAVASVGADLSAAVALHVGPMPENGTALELELGPGAVAHQVHLLPLRRPEAQRSPLVVSSVEDAEVVVIAGRRGFVPSGERASMELTRAPTRGRLYQIGWESGVAEGPALRAGDVLPDLAGSVTYVPEADMHGLDVDDFEVRFRSALSGLVSDPLRVQLDIFALNDLPEAQAANATVAEDSAEGVRIGLEASDAEGKAGLVISSLPLHGRLFVDYAFDAQPWARREISRPYALYDVGTDVTSQYVYQVRAVGTSSGSGLNTGYHAVNVIGSPQCAHQGHGECESDDRFAEVDPSPILRHDLVLGPASLLEGVEAEADTLLFYRVTAVYGANELFDLREEPLYRYDLASDGETTIQSRCRLAGNSYPDLCEALPEGAPLLEALRVPRGELQGMEFGVWCPRFRVGDIDALYESNAPSEMFGQQYATKFNPSVAYNQLRDSEEEGANAGEPAMQPRLRPYTDFIEVEYAEMVFPISVEVGQPRGGGSIVAIYALRPGAETGHDADAWVQMFSGAPQVQLVEATSRRGQFHVFQERQCREFFRTKALRLEVDTVANSDWNYIDYIKLTGAKEVQSAMLMDGVSEVVYVPDENAFGEDHFSYSVYDCGGNELRQSGDHVVAVHIDARPDDPEVRVSPPGNVYVYSENSFFREEQDRVPFSIEASDPDLEAVSIEWVTLPALGTLRLANASRESALDQASLAAMSAGESVRLLLDYEPERCTERGLPLGEGTFGFIVQDSMSLVVMDSSGRRVAHEIVFEVVCEDYGYDFSVDSAAVGICALNITCAILCVLWALVHRKHQIVKAAQMPFLLLIAAGCCISSSSIIPLVVHDQLGPRAGTNGGNAAADGACQSTLALFGMGFVLSFASLFVKMYRVHKIFSVAFGRAPKGKLTLKVTNASLVRMISAFCGVELALILVWTMVDPIHFRRDVVNRDVAGNALVSVGYCFSNHSDVFVVTFCAYHLLILVLGAWLCYQTMGISSAFSEAKYVSVAIIGNLEVVIIAIPVLWIVRDSPSSSVFVQAGVVALNDLGVLAFIFLPKIFFQLTGHIEDGHGAEFLSNDATRNVLHTPPVKVSKALPMEKQESVSTHEHSTVPVISASSSIVVPRNQAW